jgi:peptidylprolyl isomerase
VSGTAGVTVEGGRGEKPQVTVPGGEAPAELVIHDLWEGEGEPAAPGGTVNAHYVGVGWDSGRPFDASWDRGAPLNLPLARVIAGWQQGIPGMRPGGRRLLVIPSGLAYGSTPPPGSGIGAGEALVFVIDLVG